MRVGGVAMWVIAAGSVVAVALTVERLLYLRGFAAGARSLHDEAAKALLRGDAAGARALCERSTNPAAAFYLAGLERVARGQSAAGAVARERKQVAADMRAWLWALGTIGATMPFVGLFGTVVGIMRAFKSMAESGTGGFTVVAAGISEALVATAGGIAVAVEAVVFFNYLQARIQREAAELQHQSEEFLEVLEESKSRPPAAAPSPTAAPVPGAAPATA